jgi:hypothetical protein
MNFSKTVACVILMAASSFALQAATTNSLATNKTSTVVAKKPASTVKQLPFSGHIAAIDKATKTLTLTGEKKRQVHITAETKITRAGKITTFDDALVGEEVAGYAKELDGKLEPLSIRFGPKVITEKPATANTKPAPPQK